MLEPCTPRARQKCRQIMDGAARIFDEQGFEGASVDMIAEAADVSKATLYKYFANKQELFKAVIQLQCKVYSERIEKLSKIDGTLEENLRVIASTIGQTFTAPALSNLFRLAVAETTRFPEIGRTFYESGPKTGETLITAILQKHIDTGELDIDDVNLAARQLLELVKADFFHVSIFGIRKDFTQADIDQSAENAVQTFLRAYRAR
ncbi:TetR/AcrR family transcriptional regulator [Pararhizobium sp. IMCC21322]|uniref:TetR/AcrR family transcriptional regulator n=1 Tax=Pararhizobium sp. IMCC21322 TaxID=3067903 RepID=UPI002741ED9D|nr:TetR/AcrR family transcriptional regulator [Pararhizobium sp. IMCC21322]